jgi:hypothetical protein
MLDEGMCMLMEHVYHFVEVMDGFNFLALVEYFGLVNQNMEGSYHRLSLQPNIKCIVSKIPPFV